MGGGGGGKPSIAQGGGTDASKIEKALEKGVELVFEEIVFSILKNNFPEWHIEKRLALNDAMRADLLVKIDNEIILVEVKHRNIQQDAITQTANYMNAFGSERAILITNSKANSDIEKYAKLHKISLIENVQSEKDLINKLKKVNFTKKDFVNLTSPHDI